MFGILGFGLLFVVVSEKFNPNGYRTYGRNTFGRSPGVMGILRIPERQREGKGSRENRCLGKGK